MDTLDIPELLKIPDTAPCDANPVAIADFLMTALLRKQPAMLYADAEFQNGDVRWFIRDAAHREECVTTSKTIGEFRSVLARFGHHYMSVQLYAGHIARDVTQNGQKFACEIFMSNQGRTGFWIRVYAHVTSQATLPALEATERAMTLTVHQGEEDQIDSRLPLWIALIANALSLALTLQAFWIPADARIRPMGWLFWIVFIGVGALVVLS